MFAQQRKWVAIEFGGRLRQICERLHQRTLGFVKFVEHGESSYDENVAVQYNRSGQSLADTSVTQ
jgi:lantibiotic modifying enzyme